MSGPNRVVIVQPDGTVQIKSIGGYTDIQAELNGGWLERVPIGAEFNLYVDEDGIAKQLPRNQVATDVVTRMLAKLERTLFPGDYIKGAAVFIGFVENEDPEEGHIESDLPQEIVDEFFPGVDAT